MHAWNWTMFLFLFLNNIKSEWKLCLVFKILSQDMPGMNFWFSLEKPPKCNFLLLNETFEACMNAWASIKRLLASFLWTIQCFKVWAFTIVQMNLLSLKLIYGTCIFSTEKITYLWIRFFKFYHGCFVPLTTHYDLECNNCRVSPANKREKAQNALSKIEASVFLKVSQILVSIWSRNRFLLLPPNPILNVTPKPESQFQQLSFFPFSRFL